MIQEVAMAAGPVVSHLLANAVGTPLPAVMVPLVPGGP